MSRFEIEMDNGNTFTYGFDENLRTYFWQVFDQEDELLVDEGNPGDARTGGQLLTAIHKFGLEKEISDNHLAQAGLDIPITNQSIIW